VGELADYRVPSVEDVVQVGDEIMVMVTEIDRMGRINLSRRAVLEGGRPEEALARVSAGRGGGGGGPRRRPDQSRPRPDQSRPRPEDRRPPGLMGISRRDPDQPSGPHRGGPFRRTPPRR